MTREVAFNRSLLFGYFLQTNATYSLSDAFASNCLARCDIAALFCTTNKPDVFFVNSMNPIPAFTTVHG
jgi:hypothetical protein